MTKIGLPVPPGFTITTRACIHYSKHKTHPKGLDEEIEQAMKRLEEETGKGFGKSGKNGMLLLSVRSGAAQSMPGMMDVSYHICKPPILTSISTDCPQPGIEL